MTAHTDGPSGETGGRKVAGTPGPWEAVVMGSEGYAVMGPPREGRITRTFVARCGMNDWDTDKENAQVIATLPELVAVLIEARAEVDRWGYGDFHWGETPRDPGVLATLERIDAALAKVGPSGRSGAPS